MTIFLEQINQLTEQLCGLLETLPLEQKVEALNEVKQKLHQVSPFKNEPVDCVVWVKQEVVEGNDYNPNHVAHPEMKLLELSITQDGYTQPIVGFETEQNIEVVDGFDRNPAYFSEIGTENVIPLLPDPAEYTKAEKEVYQRWYSLTIEKELS